MKRIIDSKGFDSFGRPCKDLYFMKICFDAAERSLDPDTQCGCVVTDKDGGVLCTGYNSPPRNSVDENIPLTRPEKYYYFEHSERNAIYNAARNGIPLDGSCFYVTGLPCYDCLRGIIQVGAKRCVWGPLGTNMQGADGYMTRYNILLTEQDLRLERFQYDETLLKIKPELNYILKDRPKVELILEQE
tara:strand:- start:12690 stop:13253 length:564 start_codon:yes stop_codon:yes gene_type:complete